MEHIGYTNVSGNPSTLDRGLLFTVSDGDHSHGQENIGTASATVHFGIGGSINQPPDTLPGSGVGNEDSVIAVSLSGNDVGGTRVDAAGNVYVTGAFEGTTTFGTKTLVASGNDDVFVMKVDNAGNVVWVAGM